MTLCGPIGPKPWEDDDISGRRGRTRPPTVSLEPPWTDASIDPHKPWSEVPEAPYTILITPPPPPTTSTGALSALAPYLTPCGEWGEGCLTPFSREMGGGLEGGEKRGGFPPPPSLGFLQDIGSVYSGLPVPAQPLQAYMRILFKNTLFYSPRGEKIHGWISGWNRFSTWIGTSPFKGMAFAQTTLILYFLL